MADNEKRIPIAEEELVVGKEIVETGRVRVSTRVEEEERKIRETLARERVRVERVPIDEVRSEPPTMREEDGRLVVPVFEEVLVKRFRVTEELHLIRERSQEEVEGSVPLRKTVVEVDRD